MYNMPLESNRKLTWTGFERHLSAIDSSDDVNLIGDNVKQ